MKMAMRFGLMTLCCALAVWATADLAAKGAPPASFNHRGHNGFDGRFGFGGGYGAGYGWGGWGGELFGVELGGNEDRIPFYALHPPVYYSYPIARPYGDSPFAYPPGLYAAGTEEGGPKMIVNPYALPDAAPAKAGPNAAPSKSAPNNPNPPAPAPAGKSPSNVKPTAGRTASLLEESQPVVDSLPAPEEISLSNTDPSAESHVHVVMNPYVR